MSDPAADPFGTAALRAAVLAAWHDSPTRLREDAATEADLVRAGYRDRLLTELAQNAADAATKSGVAGRLLVRLDGRTLHLSNTGAPLDVSGVHALTALRASAKADPTATVGRFGVGFTAVLAVSDEIDIRSITGSLRFSRELTWDALHQNAIHIPDGGNLISPGGGDVRAGHAVGGFVPPVLRLAWPIAASPAPGADTEVVLRLRDDIDTVALLDGMRAEAVDLLLELPALHSIRIGDDELATTVRELASTDLEQADLSELRIDGPGTRRRVWWQYRTVRARWLLPVRDGRPVASGHDVLRAPTRSDEELSLPALLIADIPMQPDRRRLIPGARVGELAEGYAGFGRALPAQDRLILVPAPGFARSEADGLLRESLVRELRTQPWLPVVSVRPALPSSELGTPAGELSDTVTPEAVVAPTRASVFTGLSSELAELLDNVVGPLVIPELSGRGHAEALAVLDVHRLGLARLAELSGGLARTPHWWHSLYAALAPWVADQLAAEELGALAVPLADGRLVTGPRTVVLDDQLEVAIPVHWARLVHPAAAHPLLARLGARSATADDLLSDPGLHAELTHRPDDPDTADAILRLAAHADPTALPSWLGLLELPDTTGELRPADELLLPAAPLADLLVEDAPFGTVSAELVDRYGADALRAVGVGWSFGVIAESDPTGPDHQLDDEENWWSSLPEDPPELAAVRDLDLVADTAWPEALRQLISDGTTLRLLADRDGYTAWWLRRHAHIHGTSLGLFRHPADPEFAGLLHVFDVDVGAGVDALRTVLADPNAMTTDLAAALLEALADPAKSPAPEVITHTHRRLAAAVEQLDLDDLDLPDRVRALSGSVVEAEQAMVLDRLWFGLAVSPDRLVVGDTDTAPALATLLDLPLVSEVVTAEVLGTGRRTTWSDEPLGMVLRQLWAAVRQPHGELVLHDNLTVRLAGAVQTTVSVPLWCDGPTTYIQVPQRQVTGDSPAQTA